MTSKPEVGWTKDDLPCLTGKLAVVTGGTAGLGLEVALGLVGNHAEVIIVSRDPDKGEKAIEKVTKEVPDAKITYTKMDLGSLKEIDEFAKNFNEKHDKLDFLINNAGIMGGIDRVVTPDGFESVFGVNHLGHFYLTSKLLPPLRRAKGRVVTVYSHVARKGFINFKDLMSADEVYSGWKQYKQSKLANLLFSFELQRKSDDFGWGISAVATHPGYVGSTDLFKERQCLNCCYQCCHKAGLGHHVSKGAEAILYACSGEAKPGLFYGPRGALQLKGHIGRARIPKKALNEDTAKRLWHVSVDLTGADWGEKEKGEGQGQAG